MFKRTILLSLAIALLLAFFIGYGIEVFHDGATYEDFCSPRVYEARNETACQEQNGTWRAYPEPVPPTAKPIEYQSGNCETPYSCQEEYTNAATTHDRIVFIVAVIAGLIAVVMGSILKHEVVSTGLIGGGVLSMLYGTIRYWQHANNILKFILLGIALGVVIWIAIKKIKER